MAQKPTDMDRHTKKRYYQLLDGVKTNRSKNKKYTKSLYNRVARHSITTQCHKALNDPKLDIYDPDQRVLTWRIFDYGGSYVPYGYRPSKDSSWVHYDLRMRWPDPTSQEIKRLPKWMKAKIFRNLKRDNDTLRFFSRWSRSYEEIRLPIKLNNEWHKGT